MVISSIVYNESNNNGESCWEKLYISGNKFQQVVKAQLHKNTKIYVETLSPWKEK